MKRNIERLFEVKHGIGALLIQELDEKDLSELRAIIKESDNPRRFRSLEILARSDALRTIPLLREILEDSDEDMVLRAAAASYLGLIGGDEAESVLVHAMFEAEEVVLRAKITAALGRVGTSLATTDVLKKLEQDPEDVVRRQASFSLALIIHRLGEVGFKPPKNVETLDIPEEKASESIALTRPDAKYLKPILTSFSQDMFGVRPSISSTFAIDCDSYYLLCLHEDLFKAGMSSLLVKRPILAGVLAERAREDGSFSTRRVILAGPSGGSAFYIAAYRTDGILTHLGSGTVKKTSAEFYIHAIATKGSFPIFIHGRLRGRRLLFTKAIFGKVKTPAHAPGTFQPIPTGTKTGSNF